MPDIICVPAKDAIMKMARSLQEETRPVPLRQLLGQVTAAEAESPSGLKALRAAHLPARKAKLTQRVCVGNSKEQEDGDAQEEAAVCRDSLSW